MSVQTTILSPSVAAAPSIAQSHSLTYSHLEPFVATAMPFSSPSAAAVAAVEHSTPPVDVPILSSNQSPTSPSTDVTIASPPASSEAQSDSLTSSPAPFAAAAPQPTTRLVYKARRRLPPPPAVPPEPIPVSVLPAPATVPSPAVPAVAPFASHAETPSQGMPKTPYTDHYGRPVAHPLLVPQPPVGRCSCGDPTHSIGVVFVPLDGGPPDPGMGLGGTVNVLPPLPSSIRRRHARSSHHQHRWTLAHGHLCRPGCSWSHEWRPTD